MFSQILYTQWKWTRYGLIPLILIAFAIPVLTVGRGLSVVVDLSPGQMGLALMQNSEMSGPFYPISAALTGLIVALASWYWDDRGNHMYALSLPLPRWQYSLERMASGALLLVIPTIALWAGSMVASASVTIPEPVQAYPMALALRYYLASLLCFSLFFALAAGTMRTALIVISVLPALIIMQAVVGLAGVDTGDIVGEVIASLTNWPGPFGVFLGSWMLFDV